MPFRQNAPPPPPPSTREADLLLEGEMRRRRRRLAIMISVVVLLVCSPFLVFSYHAMKESWAKTQERKKHELTDEEKEEVRANLPHVKTLLNERDSKWMGAMQTHILSGIQPSERRCPIAAQFGFADHAVYTVVEPGDSPGKSPVTDEVRTKLQTIEDRDKATREDLDDIRSMVTGTYFSGRTSVLIVADDHHAPTLVGSGLSLSYAPGTLRGRAYVYDHHDEKVVCVGDIDVKNTEDLEIEYSSNESSQRADLESKLKANLDAHVLSALDRRLRVPL